MNISTFLISLSVIVLLMGCEAREQVVSEEASGVIPQYQLDALDKAKSVEGINMDAESARREQMEKQGI